MHVIFVCSNTFITKTSVIVYLMATCVTDFNKSLLEIVFSFEE